ncbi:hypothetical protein JNM87_00445 [Candidatus Saccharibacteria bacterium]|nr:hypothetical protein [Candidatus Saccharibacteria bacterium]
MTRKPPTFLDVDHDALSFIWPLLKRGGYEKNEEDLLRAISENKSKNLVLYAVWGLRICGTAKSLPLLKTLTSYPMEDVKTSLIVTIGVIGGASQSSYFTRMLDSKTYAYKMFPMIMLSEVGGEEVKECRKLR